MNVAVFASMVTHDAAGMGSCTGYPSVLHSALCFLRPAAVCSACLLVTSCPGLSSWCLNLPVWVSLRPVS